jgi:hypothetical protein
MAFPTLWKRKCALVIQAAQVSSDQSNFPILLNKDNLPAEMFGVGPNAALNGGGDIRVTTDQNGLTQIPIEIGQFVTSATAASQTGEIWVKITSLSSVTNTTIYVWYGGPTGTTQPADTTTYGAEAVWETNYKGVWHLNESWGTGAGAFIESTASNKHGTGSIVEGTPNIASTPGKWGGGAMRATNVADHSAEWRITISGTSPLDFNVRGSTMEAWVQLRTDVGWWMGNGNGTSDQGWSMRGLGTNATNKVWWNRAGGDTAFVSTGSLTADAWTHVMITVAADGAAVFYLNGSASGSWAAGTVASDAGGSTLALGTGFGGDTDAGREGWNGNLDEVRVHSTSRAAGWVTTSYNTTNAPASFVVKGIATFAGPRKRHVMYQDPGMI